MKQINLLSFITLLILTVHCFVDAQEESIRIVENDNNIAFDLADITASFDTGVSTVQLEAYRSRINDGILQSQNKSLYSQLSWVTIGHPTLAKTISVKSPTKKQLFHFNDEGFYTFIEMLTSQQRDVLLRRAMSKYNIDLVPDQMANLLLSKLDCSLSLYSEGRKLILTGEVTNFKEFPLRLDFEAPMGTFERVIFEDRLNKDGDKLDIMLNCNGASTGVSIKTNKLSITATQMNNLELSDKVFGPVDETYVTREQMSSLTNEIYTKLNILEEYQMPESQFKDAFIDDFIKQINTVFAQVSLDDAINAMSKYTVDFTEDLKPDIVKQQMEKMLNIKQTDNKSHIVVNDEYMNHLVQTNKVETQAGGGVKFMGIQIGGSGAKISASTSDWLSAGTSVKDQLHELNTYVKDEMEWQFEGEKIVPKSINVAKMQKGSFSKTFNFERIKRTFMDAPFLRKFSLYSKRSTDLDTVYEKLVKTVNSRLDSLQSQAVQVTVVTVRVESGVTGLVTSSTPVSNATHRKTVTFSRPFKSVPTVVAALINIDAAYAKFNCNVEKVTTTSFDYVCVIGAAQLLSAGFNWMATGQV